MALDVKYVTNRHFRPTVPRSVGHVVYLRPTLALMEPSRQECLAAAIKSAMDDAGVTPDGLGELVGTSGRTVKRWRAGTGTPDALQLRPMADRLCVDPMLFIDPPVPAPYPLEAYRLSPEEAALAAARLAQRDLGGAVEVPRGAEARPSERPRRPVARARR